MKNASAGLTLFTVCSALAFALAAQTPATATERADGGPDDYVRVDVPHRAGPTAPVRIKLDHGHDFEVSAKLNGHRVKDAFAPRFAAVRRIRLSRSQGLRFGKNRLRVKVVRDDGGVDVERHRFVVSHRRPLAAAGHDLTNRGATRFALDGRKSKAAHRKDKLSYKWRLVHAPRHSQAKLRKAHRARPKLVPDELGDYRLRLRVSERFRRSHGRHRTLLRSSGDTVTASNASNALPIGTPLQTVTSQNGSFGTLYGDQFEPLGANAAVQALFIDRGTGALLKTTNYGADAGAAGDLLSDINAQAANKPFIAVSAYTGPQGQLDPAYNSVVNALSGQSFPNSEFSDGDAFSVIGIPGTPSAAWVNPGWNPASGLLHPILPGGLNGYLQPGSPEPNLSFTPAQRLAFDSQAPGAAANQNLITLGDQRFASGPLTGCANPVGGFQVQFISAEFLKPADAHTFTTNGCGQAADEQEQAAMAQFLQNDRSGDGAALIAIQSIGDARGSDDGNWDQLIAAIGTIGGSEPIFGDVNKGYALLAGVDLDGHPLSDFQVVESDENPTATGLEAHATAVLAQSRAGYYAPRESSGSFSDFSFDFSVLAYQPSSNPPFPNSNTAEEQAALAYIANQVLNLNAPSSASCYVPPEPDVRSEYCNDKYDTDWLGYAETLRSTPYPTDQAGNFSEATWNSVVSGLDGAGQKDGYSEFGAVQNVWNVFGNIQGAYGNAGTISAISKAAAANVETSIVDLETTSGVSGEWEDIFADALDSASLLFPEAEGVELVGLLAGSLYLTEDIATQADGAPVLGQFQIKADEIAGDVSGSLDSATAALANVQEIILTDSAKLKAFNEGSQYDASPDQLANIAPSLALGASQFTYEALMPAAYELVQLNREGRNAAVTNANDYVCSSWIKSVRYNPFDFKGKSTADSSQWQPLDRLYVLVLNGQPLPDNDNEAMPKTAPSSVTKPLFEAASFQDGVPQAFGFDPDVFFPGTYDISKAPDVDCH